ncbi:restriction endonuclease S subunit [Belliella baltica DSM 15883]|uniref:Restriction endonuclease S subunit n=1 Tax=Belliella baltica (strain DSM 15883 / CIP 108006 / LMG 21964 / BA134) TaxID=866536 RepID=I3Z6K7_BELBD|nr:restriction endonuclease subunit S [Belliella baltica]AFL84875.1 restriction endonuclease S subunit [Belliella baltica DSM 15883]
MKKDWIEVELKTVSEIITGGTPIKADLTNYNSNDFPFYKPTDLNQGINTIDSQDFMSLKAYKLARKAPKNSILVTCIGATIGKTGLIKKDGGFNQQINAVIPDRFVHYKFLYFQIVSQEFQNKIKDNSSSTTLPILNKSKFSILKIKLSPLPEQRAIVARIEELFSELDHSISNLQSALSKLEIYRQAVLKKAFEGGFTSNIDLVLKLPNNWRKIRLGKILKVSSGKGLTSNQMDGGKFFVYGGNGINGNHSEFLFSDPKLIIGRVGVRCGVTHITLPFSWVTDNALVIEFKQGEIHDLHFMKLKLEFENLNKLSNSTAQPVISGSKIYDYELNIPEYSEQLQIVQEIESRLSVADKMTETIQTSLKKAEAMRQSILKKAFEGKLLTASELEACRKEADWEPAERLLERIKSEKI